ncbi:hypothetical protein L596_011032 [Steinernema carpocapsae]|uniref:Uncharacterized protein n=1 Tax=Steinernema carpocapsae TaxID=34508 RepID=A0A4U5NRR0_STECR|nr:hypothetical protein L596_011032 [Steinernema carpocapsae]
MVTRTYGCTKQPCGGPFSPLSRMDSREKPRKTPIFVAYQLTELRCFARSSHVTADHSTALLSPWSSISRSSRELDLNKQSQTVNKSGKQSVDSSARCFCEGGRRRVVCDYPGNGAEDYSVLMRIDEIRSGFVLYVWKSKGMSDQWCRKEKTQKINLT